MRGGRTHAHNTMSEDIDMNTSRQSFADRVNPYVGTIGHLLTATKPLVHMPHGMAQIMPILDSGIMDRFTADIIYGFPMNHTQIMPDVGKAPVFQSQYDHDFEDVRCYQGRVLLEDSGIWADYTVTQHCALYRFRFPEGVARHLRIMPEGNGETERLSDTRYAGWAEERGVRCHYALELSESPASAEQEGGAHLLRFAPGGEIVAKVGLSYIDVDQAWDNLARELTGVCFEDAAQAVKAAWDSLLSKIEVEGGTEAQQTTFYTAMYRVHQRMINITEYGRYYSGFDGKVHEDERDFYVNDGIWDTYRGAHPLQLLVEPTRQMDIIESYLRQYAQCGWLPSFPHVQGSLPIMLGKHATAMIADTWQKGHRDFDIETAYQAMVKNMDEATKLPWTPGGLTEYDECYLEKGFFPALAEGETESIEKAHPFERRQSVAVTLEVSYDDWCLSQVAKALGKEEDAERYRLRGQNYRNLFNAETGFMSPKTADGKWVPNFDPKLSGGQGGRAYFAECNAWTYTLHVQHDVLGLAALFGGKEKLIERLDQLYREQYGTPKYTFLGQFPDSTGLIGQFCMGNEPSFHIPYMYNQAGQPYKTQRKVREIMALWFNDTPLGICGDEDGGAMSAWFAFSAMGFYPFCPGRPEYEIGSPLFDLVKIHLENGNTFTIEAKHNGPKAKYIQSAVLNGRSHDTFRLSHAAIVSGGALTLEMGERPNARWGTAE